MSQNVTEYSGEATAALVVDDDPILRSLLTAKLAPFVTDIVEAEDGADAWRKVREHRLKIAFVDLEMPNINGITLIQCIRSHPTTRHLPIVVITSRQDGEALRNALDAGATSYLTKPVNWSMFSRHVEHLIALSDAQMRAEQRAAQAESVLAWLTDERLDEAESAVALAETFHETVAASGGDERFVLALQELARVLRAQSAFMREANGMKAERVLQDEPSADAA
jgi:CheY-like chemotaxis protein